MRNGISTILGNYSGVPLGAWERDVPEAASCEPWNRTVEGLTSAVSGAMEGEANEAEGICRLREYAGSLPSQAAFLGVL